MRTELTPPAARACRPASIHSSRGVCKAPMINQPIFRQEFVRAVHPFIVKLCDTVQQQVQPSNAPKVAGTPGEDPRRRTHRPPMADPRDRARLRDRGRVVVPHTGRREATSRPCSTRSGPPAASTRTRLWCGCSSPLAGSSAPCSVGTGPTRVSRDGSRRSATDSPMIFGRRGRVSRCRTPRSRWCTSCGRCATELANKTVHDILPPRLGADRSRRVRTADGGPGQAQWPFRSAVSGCDQALPVSDRLPGSDPEVGAGLAQPPPVPRRSADPDPGASRHPCPTGTGALPHR